MLRLPLVCLALLALVPPSRAATVVAGQDASGSEFAVSPQHPLAVMGIGPGGGTSGPFTPLGCANWLAVTSATPVLLSNVAGGIPAGATLVGIVPTVGVVMRDDGGVPTVAGPGNIIAAGMYFPSSVTPLSNIQFIAQTTSGFITTCFER